MRTYMLAGAVLLAAALVTPALGADVKDFHHTWAEVQQAASEQNKPIYLHFTTEWCHWCRVIEQETYPAPEADAALRNFVAASLDVTENPQNRQLATNQALFQKYGGTGFPYLVMLTPDGEGVLNTISGYVPAPAFVQELATAQERNRRLQELEQAEDKDSLEYNVEAMTAYADVRMWPKATAAAQKVVAAEDAAPPQKAQARLVLLRSVLNQPGWTVAGAKEHMDAIRTLDPRNEHTVLEQALMAMAQGHFEQAQQFAMRQSMPAAMAQVRASLPYLEELAQGSFEVSQPQQLWVMVGQARAALGDRDAAVEAFRKAYEADPDSPLAAQLQQVLRQLEQPEAPPPAGSSAPAPSAGQ